MRGGKRRIVQVGYLPTCFLVKLLLVRCFVEIQVTPENFIWTFPGKNHFHPQRFNFSRHKKHGSASSDCGYIKCFSMVNDFLNCIYAFLKWKCGGNQTQNFVIIKANESFALDLTWEHRGSPEQWSETHDGEFQGNLQPLGQLLDQENPEYVKR